MKGSVAHPRTGDAIRRQKIIAKRENVRDRLVTTGCHLFAERGLANVSVEDILIEVKISRRTFYGYFANKYELAASIINSVLEDGSGMLADLPNRQPEFLLPGIVDCYLHLWASHSDALSVINSIEPEVLPYIEDGHQKFGTALKELLKQAEKAGVLRNDDATYTFKVISRTAVPLLKIYSGHSDGESLYRDAMLALLGKHT
jgi:AcrR family transcriptional regulator